MQKDEKQQIAARLKDYCVQKGSQNKAANSMNGEDVAAVCVANGVTDTKTINRIIDDCECDLRRVKRAVWAIRKEGGRA